MGNTCTTSREVVDNRRAGRYEEAASKPNNKGQNRDGNASTATVASKQQASSPPREEDAAPMATSVVKNIEALQHTLKPAVSVVSQDLYHSDFRQFTSIFGRGKAALAVASCAAAQQPRHVLAAGEDRSVALLNYETGHVMRRWVHAHQGDINCITTPISSGHFATGSRDKVVKVWNLTSDSAVAELEGHTLNVAGVDMSPDGTLLVSGSKDNTVRLWDVERSEELFCGDVKLNIVHFVRFMPSMNCVAQGGEDLAVRLWDVRTNGAHSDLHLSQTIEGMDYYPVCCETVPEDPYTLLTGHNGVNGCGSYVAQWDVRTGNRTALYKGHGATVSAVRMVAASVYGKGSFFTSSDDGSFGIWNLDDGAADGEVELPAEHCFTLPEGRVTTFEAEDNGDVVIALSAGCLVVLRPSLKGDSVVPSLRLRYVGVPTART